MATATQTEEAFGAEAGPEVHPLRNTRVRRADRRAANALTDYASLYDSAMADWVTRADAELIEYFGFAPFKPPPCAVWALSTS